MLEGLEVLGAHVHSVPAVGEVRSVGASAVARLAALRCANEATRTREPWSAIEDKEEAKAHAKNIADAAAANAEEICFKPISLAVEVIRSGAAHDSV